MKSPIRTVKRIETVRKYFRKNSKVELRVIGAGGTFLVPDGFSVFKVTTHGHRFNSTEIATNVIQDRVFEIFGTDHAEYPLSLYENQRAEKIKKF